MTKLARMRTGPIGELPINSLNAVFEAVEKQSAAAVLAFPGNLQTSRGKSHLPCLVSSPDTTDGTRLQGQILGLGDPLGTTGIGQNALVEFIGKAPKEGEPFAVLQAGCERNTAGVPAAIQGYTWARVNVTDTDHEGAKVVDDDYTLRSSEGTADARIHYKIPTTDAYGYWCLIELSPAKSATVNQGRAIVSDALNGLWTQTVAITSAETLDGTSMPWTSAKNDLGMVCESGRRVGLIDVDGTQYVRSVQADCFTVRRMLSIPSVLGTGIVGAVPVFRDENELTSCEWEPLAPCPEESPSSLTAPPASVETMDEVQNVELYHIGDRLLVINDPKYGAVELIARGNYNGTPTVWELQ